MKNLKILTRVTLAMAILINSQSSFAESEASKREMLSCKDAAEKLFLENPLYANESPQRKNEMLKESYNFDNEDWNKLVEGKHPSSVKMKAREDAEEEIRDRVEKELSPSINSRNEIKDRINDIKQLIILIKDSTSLDTANLSKAKVAALENLEKEFRSLSKSYHALNKEISEKRRALYYTFLRENPEVYNPSIIPNPRLFERAKIPPLSLSYKFVEKILVREKLKRTVGAKEVFDNILIFGAEASVKE